MKKTLLALSLAVAATATAVTPEYQWGKTLLPDGNKQSSVYQVLPNGDDYLVVAGVKTTPTLTWGGEAVAIPEFTASSDDNLFIADVNAAGEIRWTVTSSVGNFKANATLGTRTPDGGFVFVGQLRHNAADFGDELLLSMTDSKGNVVELAGPEANGLRFYTAVIFKLTADGECAWIKTIEQSSVYAGNEVVCDAMSIVCPAVDGKGNIYVGGRYLTALSIDGTEIIPAGVNAPATVGANVGDGDLWLAKLDANGAVKDVYYSGKDNAEKTAKSVCAQALAVEGNTLYVIGKAQGVADGDKLMLFGQEVELGTLVRPLFAAVSTDDLSVAKTVNVTPTEGNSKGSLTIEFNKLAVAGDEVFATGRMTGVINAGEKVLNTGVDNNTYQTAIFVGYSADNGEIATMGQSSIHTTVSDYNSVIVDDNAGKIYAVGYGLNKGFLVEEFTHSNGVEEGVEPIVLIGGAGTFGIHSATFNNATKTLVGGVRSNKPMTYYGTEDTAADIKAFQAAVVAYTLPGVVATEGNNFGGNEPDVPGVRGDVNGDGVVDITDVQEVLNIMSGNE